MIIQDTTTIISNDTESKVFNEDKDSVLSTDTLGTVVNKSALSNISLTSIPDVIQDAINQSSIDTETRTLANNLIRQLRTDIDNIEDGVYNKTYIDEQITYIEEVLGQKVNSDIVSQIADTRVAIATQDLASTTTVNLLSNRVGNTETEILNVKDSISSETSARASAIESLNASVNDVFSNYSSAIGLTVNADGNATSSKIDTLTTNVGTVVERIDYIEQNPDESWKAGSMNLVTSPTGAITGYSFVDGTGLTSNFTINADSFKIANSTNTYTPFTIDETGIKFNGKVSFSNTTDIPDYALQSTLDNNVATLQTSIQNLTGVSQSLIDDINAVIDIGSDVANIQTQMNDALALETSARESAILSLANDLGLETTNRESDVASLISSISEEVSNRTNAIQERIEAEILLDNKITSNEQAILDSSNALTLAYQNYANTVAQALIDNEITDAEANAILEAQGRIDTAKATLEETILSVKSELETSIGLIDTQVSQQALDIANLDGKIDTKEAELINSINNEATLRALGIQERIEAEALLDGKITDAEQSVLDKATELTLAYQLYTDTVKQALIDGEISDAEQNAINEAQNRVDTAKAELEGTISTLETSLNNQISTINTTLSDNALAIANTDNKIDTKEAELINAINQETINRLSDIQTRIDEEARLDDLITAEEQARINAVASLVSAYKSYSDAVAQALIDGEINDAEQNAINEAQLKVNEAKAILENSISTLEYSLTSQISNINTSLSINALEIANVDGKIDTKEAELIASIQAEQQARIDAINERITAEANLDGKITDNEQAIIDKSNELTIAYKNYADTVKQALVDGEISQAEQNAINEAQARVDVVKNDLIVLGNEFQAYSSDLSSLVNSFSTELSNTQLEIANVDGKIDDTEQSLINSINDEATQRASDIQDRITEEARLDGLISAEEQARIDSANALTLAYQNYTNTVKQSLIDGEISDAENNAILEAQNRVDVAKADLQNQIDSIDIPTYDWQSEVQAVLDNNETIIDGSKITTGTIQARSLDIQDINAVGGIKASKIDVNNGNGFVLNSEVIGNTDTPNIQGGYIKGATIEAPNLIGTSLAVNDVKVKADGYPNNYGPLVLRSGISSTGGSSLSLETDTFISMSSGSSYNRFRMCASNTLFHISAQAYGYFLSSGEAYVSTSLKVEYTTNDGASWNTIYSVGKAGAPRYYEGSIELSSNTNIRFRVSTSSGYSSTLSVLVTAENSNQ